MTKKEVVESALIGGIIAFLTAIMRIFVILGNWKGITFWNATICLITLGLPGAVAGALIGKFAEKNGLKIGAFIGLIIGVLIHIRLAEAIWIFKPLWKAVLLSITELSSPIIGALLGFTFVYTLYYSYNLGFQNKKKDLRDRAIITLGVMSFIILLFLFLLLLLEKYSVATICFSSGLVILLLRFTNKKRKREADDKIILMLIMGYVYSWDGEKLRELGGSGRALDICVHEGILFEAEPAGVIDHSTGDFLSIEREGWVQAVCSHRGKLYDASGSREVGPRTKSYIYDTLADKLIAERKGRTMALCSHDGKLYDGSLDYGVYETFTNTRITDRPTLTVLCSHDGKLYDGGMLGVYETFTGDSVAIRNKRIRILNRKWN